MIDCVAVLLFFLCGFLVSYMTCTTATEKVFFSRHGFYFSLSAVTLLVALPCRERLQYMV